MPGSSSRVSLPTVKERRDPFYFIEEEEPKSQRTHPANTCQNQGPNLIFLILKRMSLKNILDIAVKIFMTSQLLSIQMGSAYKVILF